MPLEKPMEVEKDWKPLVLPEMQQWDHPGIMIAGKLISVNRIEVGKPPKPVLQYIIATGVKDQRIKFLGTYDLAQKLTREHLGLMVRIKYLGEDQTVKKGDNYMKVFDVHVKPDPNAPPARDGGPITDDDIPF